jgi:polysaccharide export outer membrane protein
MTKSTALLRACLALLLACFAWGATAAQDKSDDYRLGPGDSIRILVFQNPDLTLEARVSESGTISYPLIGTVKLGGLSTDAAEQEIATLLVSGGFVKKPQVNVLLLQNRGNQVSVLGQVNRPGRFPLETFNMRLTEMIAVAGGIAPTGGDSAIVMGQRNGKPFRKEVDIAGLFLNNRVEDDIPLVGGDTVYVHRAPTFYIYGEAQRPGSYRVERTMTLQQALAQGGGPTARGTESRIRVHRRNSDGKIEVLSPALTEFVQPDDVIYVRESVF